MFGDNFQHKAFFIYQIMRPVLYFLPFIIAFLISITLNSFLVWLAKKYVLGRLRRDEKKERLGKISRLGGLAIIVSFCLTLFIDPNLYISQLLWGIIAACFFILVIGLWDDFHDLNWKYQLSFQISIAALIFILGVRIEYVTNPLGGVILIGQGLFPGFLLITFWLILLINATNWLDGVDGLSGGVALIAALTIFFLSLKPEVNQPPVGIITMALAGSLLGFLIFNFYPARIMAGTSGAIFIGFILGVLSIFAGAKIATALLVMLIPILDAFWVIVERIKSGVSIFRSDKRHLHFKLQELGWSPRKIAGFFYLITAIMAAIALNTSTSGKLAAIASVTVLVLMFLVYVNKKLLYVKKKSIRQ